MDRQLQQTQKAIMTGLVAACSLQQGLEKLKGFMGEGQDPAVASALLEDIFQASQDVIDHMGRALAIQNYSCRLQVLRTANLSATEPSSPSSAEGWLALWGEEHQGYYRKVCNLEGCSTMHSGSRPKEPQQPQHSHQAQQGRDETNGPSFFKIVGL